MQHKSIPPLKISQRVMCCMVALLLILTLASFPIKASAMRMIFDKDQGYVGNISSGGGGAVQYAAGTSLLIVMVAAAGNLADDAVSGITNLWNNLSSGVKSWFEEDAVSVFGGFPVRVPEDVVDELEEKGAAYGVSFPAEDVYLRPITGALDLSSLTFEDVYAMSLQELMVYNLSLLGTLQLALTDFRYDTYAQYKVMHNAFYEQIVETRLALNNTIQASASGIYDRLGSVATRMETQFVETRQALMNKMDAIATPMNNNITKVRNQIVEQLISTTSQLVNPLSGIKTTLEDIAADIGSLAGADSDTDDEAISIVPSLSVPALQSKLSSIVEGFNDLFQRSDDDEDKDYPWLPFNLFKNKDGSKGFFLDMFDDIEFMNTLKSFYDFVAALWLLFPLAIRYFISFAFGTPIIVGLAKMFAG